MSDGVAYFLIDGLPAKWQPAMAGVSVIVSWDAASQQFIADSSLVDRLVLPDEGVIPLDAAAFAEVLACLRGQQPIVRRHPHAARGPVFESLRPWAHSREVISDVLRELTESGLHWFILGIEPGPVHARAVLVESRSLGVACIEGNGTQFGAVTVPTPGELAGITTRYGLVSF